MKIVRKALLIVSVSALLGGCFTSGSLSRDDRLAGGTMAGAIAGGILAYSLADSTGTTTQLLWTAVGAGGGAVGGYWATDRLTRWDKSAMEDAAYKSLSDSSSNGKIHWSNDKSGNSGSFQPVRTFLDHKGRICRDFITEVTVDGKQEKAQQTACKNGAGIWVII